MTHYFITGVSAGIGAALARKLLADGHHVTGIARRQDRLDALSSEFPKFLGMACDVTQKDALAATIDQAEDTHGAINTMVLNAGIYTPQDGKSPDADVFRQHMEVNYMGVVHGLAPIIPRMVDRRSGHLVIMASVSGWMGLPKAAAYGPTKAASSLWRNHYGLTSTPKALKSKLLTPALLKLRPPLSMILKCPG